MELAYALTTYRGENLLQGFLFPSTVDIYVQPEQAQAWTRVIEEKGLLGGGNTRTRLTDEHVFYQTETYDNHPVVCVPQLIVDLLDEGGSCEEAAEKLIASYHA